jgi:hypothetical protein
MTGVGTPKSSWDSCEAIRPVPLNGPARARFERYAVVLPQDQFQLSYSCY